MDAFRRAMASPEVSSFIDRYYREQHSVAIALSAHAKYVSLARSQAHGRGSVNEILSDPRTPPGWDDHCAKYRSRHHLPNLPPFSPIIVHLYIDCALDVYPVPVPPFLQPGSYLVMVERREVPEAVAFTGRLRPVQGGTSLGASCAANAGTMACVVEDSNAAKYALSCEHVLLSNTASSDAVQQARNDGGTVPTDTIGGPAFGVALLPASGKAPYSYAAPYNRVDVAAAPLIGVHIPAPTTGEVRIAGRVRGVRRVSSIGVTDRARFVGQQSDLQNVDISRFIARTKVNIAGTPHSFGDCFEMAPLLPNPLGSPAVPGDSGALVVSDDGVAEGLGLLFSATSTHAYACFLESALSELQAAHGHDLTL